MARRTHRNPPTAVLGALAGSLMLGACAADPSRGYSFDSTYDTSVRTIAVPIFGNETYSSGLEVRLTEAIIKEIQSSTPWRVVGSESAATTLQGSLDGVSLTRLSRQEDTGLVQEQGMRVTVSFDWIDNRTGETVVSRTGFTAVSSFVPHYGVGEPIEVGENAVVRQLAEDIVAELRADW